MTSSIRIRKGTQTDLPMVHKLVVELAIYEKEPNAVTATLSDYIRDFENGCFNTLLAMEDESIVGMMLYYRTYSTWKGKMLHLEDFIVINSHRRRGIGRRLFEAFLDEAHRLNCILTRWQVLDWNEDAVSFYEEIGATIEKNWWNGKLYLENRT